MSIRDAVILVGGKGTRLQSVVSGRPKPMAEVAGRPFVEWLVLMLRAQGVQRIVFCLGYLGEVVETHFGNGRRWNIQIAYSRETVLLGTAGAVRQALEQVHSDRFVTLNGDSYCGMDLARLERAHLDRAARATLWLTHVNDCGRYGSVEIDTDGLVQSFREKSTRNYPGFISAGVYLLEREVVEAIPPGHIVSIETEIFPSMIGRGLYSVIGDSAFLDIGTPEAYATASQFFATNVLGSETYWP